MKTLLSGNEAIARGAYEYGCVFAAAYPGTPSTEILENIAKYKEIKSQWAPNEKVAMEVAIGAAMAGARSLCAMKHVGVNVAADPLMSFAFMEVKGGFVLVSADDPGMHSSQNEQDNRNYAKFAKIPVLDPSDSDEAKRFVGEAFKISETFHTPVMLRTTTRTSHGKGLVELGEPIERKVSGFEKNFEKLVVLPMNARKLRVCAEERLRKLETFAENTNLNFEEPGEGRIGFITSGIAHVHLKEVLPNAPILKIGMPYPLPLNKIRDFVSRFDRVIVVEELDPFVEEQILAAGMKVEGKNLIPGIWELNPEIIRETLGKEGIIPAKERKQTTKADAIPRPPVFCPGCPHLGIFHALKKAKAKIITGDIGCYTLAAIPPFNAMDTCVCMGASIGNAIGIEKATGSGKGIAAVIGDSTFTHSGLTGLVDAIMNNSHITIVISDNSITAMTGGQPDPRTGWDIHHEENTPMDFEIVARAMGVDHVYPVDPTDMAPTFEVVKRELEADHLSVIISQAPCVLYPKKVKRDKFFTFLDNCTACTMCSRINCQAITRSSELTEKGRNKWQINVDLCTGCGLCIQMCKFDAIRPISRKGE